jgi:hypothetical protein
LPRVATFFLVAFFFAAALTAICHYPRPSVIGVNTRAAMVNLSATNSHQRP